jgi:hypothetical protein
MPYARAKVINVTGDIKRRLSALKGPRFGNSENEVISTLLAIAENIATSLQLDMDIENHTSAAQFRERTDPG